MSQPLYSCVHPVGHWYIPGTMRCFERVETSHTAHGMFWSSHTIQSLTTPCFILCSVEVGVPSVCCGGPRVVLCVLHCTDVVCPSPGVVIPAPCCESIIDQLCPRHCGAGGPPPADVGQPTSIEARCTGWTRRTGWSLRSLTAWLPIPAVPPIGAWSTWDTCRAGKDRRWRYPVLMGCVHLIMLWVWFTTSITNNQARS